MTATERTARWPTRPTPTAQPPKARALTDRLLDAALPHVPFDGWSEATFRAAAAEGGVDPALARAACPRGALDLAVAFHRRGDDAMVAGYARPISLHCASATASPPPSATGWRRWTTARWCAAGPRSSPCRSTPPTARALVWGTADLIWTALGDTADDLNWYSKRAILSGVYSAPPCSTGWAT
jgi:ubiquinone biosynthesis protein COQ9